MSSSILSETVAEPSVGTETHAPVAVLPGLTELQSQMLQATLAAKGSLEIPLGHLHELSSVVVTIRSPEDVLVLKPKQQEIVIGHIRRSCNALLG